MDATYVWAWARKCAQIYAENKPLKKQDLTKINIGDYREKSGIRVSLYADALVGEDALLCIFRETRGTVAWYEVEKLAQAKAENPGIVDSWLQNGRLLCQEKADGKRFWLGNVCYPYHFQKSA